MRIPRTLDRPTRLLGVPFDLAMIAVAVYYLFMLFEWGLIGIPISIVVTNIYSRVRSRSLLRNIQRFIYWYFPAEVTRKTGILGHMRRIKFCADSENDNKVINNWSANVHN
jgi:type IV conjugative transfer system protein TraL